MTSPQQVEMNTRAYEFAHGKKPRGYGSWAFFFPGYDRMDQTFWFTGSYGKAVKAARAEASQRNVREVVVGS